jgi:hypothetical protein
MSFLFIDIAFIIPSFVSQVIMFLKPHLANSCFSLVDFDFQIFDSRNLRTLNLLNNPIKTLRKSIQNLYICAVLLGNITMNPCHFVHLRATHVVPVY